MTLRRKMVVLLPVLYSNAIIEKSSVLAGVVVTRDSLLMVAMVALRSMQFQFWHRRVARKEDNHNKASVTSDVYILKQVSIRTGQRKFSIRQHDST